MTDSSIIARRRLRATIIKKSVELYCLNHAKEILLPNGRVRKIEFTIKDVAKLTNIKYGTLRQIIETGQLNMVSEYRLFKKGILKEMVNDIYFECADWKKRKLLRK